MNTPSYTTSSFIPPDLDRELGEIERVAKTFDKDNQEEFIRVFLERARSSSLIALTEKIWSTLENSDSFDVATFEDVRYHAVEGHPDSPRDWESLRDALEGQKPVYAPIIVKMGTRYHLVSGNTRLMVCRVLGITPHVLIVDMTDVVT